jgi:hypothetical protein
LHRVDELTADHPGIDLAGLQRLPVLCDCIMATQRELDAFAQLNASQAPKAIRAAMAWRRRLFSVASALALSGSLPAGSVPAARRGIGPRAQLADLREVVKWLEPHRATVEGLYGARALEYAQVCEAEATRAIGVRPRSSSDRKELSQLRDRYATLVVRGHERLRLAVALFIGLARAERIVRSLSPHRHRQPSQNAP